MRAFGIWLVFALTLAPFALLTTATMLGVLAAVVIALGKEYGLTVGLLLTGSSFAASYAVGMAVHEVGHVLGGGLVGWRARFARVGPVTWTRRGERWRCGWAWRANWLTGKVETDLGPPDHWRLVVLLLAGPVANVVLAAFVGVAVVLPAPVLVRCEAGVLAVISFSLGALSLFPIRERGQASDGLNLGRLWAYGALPVTFKKIAFEPVAARPGLGKSL
jgi:hypothetical protein